MGWAKELRIEEEEQGYSNPPEYDVCADMFPSHAMVRDFIKGKGHQGVCHFTKKHTVVLSLKDLLRFIYDEFRTYYEDPANECGFSSSNDDDEYKDTGWHKDYGYILPDSRTVQTTKEVFVKEHFSSKSKDLDMIIYSNLSCDNWVQVSPYGNTPTEELVFQWEKFSQDTINSIKSNVTFKNTCSKFFGRLSNILYTIEKNKDLLFENLSIGTILYRCVNYRNPPVLNISSLASPPTKKTTANRFSQTGKSRFYASFDEETPLVEATNNDATMKHCIGKFELIEEVKVLNLKKLPSPVFLNVKDYWGFKFLHSFAQAISSYVPENDKTRYIPTQVMTEVFENKLSNNQILGIKYGSSKSKGLGNVVLFLDQSACPNFMKLVDSCIK